MTANTLVYDCFSGISGDMHIGAMLDLGVSEEILTRGKQGFSPPRGYLQWKQRPRQEHVLLEHFADVIPTP